MNKKVLVIIFAFCVMFSVGSTIYDKIADDELTFEEKVSEAMNDDEMSVFIDLPVLIRTTAKYKTHTKDLF